MIGIIGGIFGGISGVLFIWLLKYAQTVREMDLRWIFILPLVGMMISYLRGAPRLIIGSFLTHLGGGSAGREGAVIQVSRILSEKTANFLKFTERKTHRLVIVAMGSGFGAALGAPWAGLLFGFEVRKSTFFRPRTMFQCAIATIVAQSIVRFSKVPHFHLPQFNVPDYQFKTFVLVLVIGILFGMVTLAFHLLRHRFERAFAKVSPLITGLVGGCFLTLLFYHFDLKEFQGLGEETIARSSMEILPLIYSVKKLILTTITLGTGFEGGEYFPLAFIGSTLGSAFSFIEPNLTALFAALGFVTVYAASSQTPIACTILACELYGWKILPFAALAIWFAHRINSRRI